MGFCGYSTSVVPMRGSTPALQKTTLARPTVQDTCLSEVTKLYFCTYSKGFVQITLKCVLSHKTHTVLCYFGKVINGLEKYVLFLTHLDFLA